jgi:hypothetical protein
MMLLSMALKLFLLGLLVIQTNHYTKTLKGKTTTLIDTLERTGLNLIWLVPLGCPGFFCGKSPL